MKTATVPTKRFAPAKGMLYRVYTWMWLFFVPVYFAVAILERPFTEFELILSSILSGLWGVWGAMMGFSWFNTWYELNENQLNYRSGFSKGSIPLDSIYKIEKTNYAVGAMKAALAGNGLLVHYNKYDDLYVAPKDKEGFLQELLRLNPNIEVKEDLDQKAKAA